MSILKKFLTANALPGVKVIAVSLAVVILTSLPYMVVSVFGDQDKEYLITTWVFIVGAMVAHLGFFVGLLWLIWDLYIVKKRR